MKSIKKILSIAVQGAILPGMILFMLDQPVRAAEVSATLQGSFPVVAAPGDTVHEAFWFQLDVSGAIPRNPNEDPVIIICIQGTLMPDGSMTCDAELVLELPAGHNYSREKTDANGNTFPMLIPKTVAIHPDVACGQTYQVEESLFTNSGSGVDFGDGATRMDLPFSIQVECSSGGCTYSQGFWKNHPEAWPTNALQLGDWVYYQDDLLRILNEPVRGNGLISLAYQLIAAKLNEANGASAPAAVGAAINSADLLIGDLLIPPVGDDWLDPAVTGGLTAILDAYNRGESAGGPPHCP